MPTIRIDNEPHEVSERLFAVIQVLLRNKGRVDWIKTGSLELHLGGGEVKLYLRDKADFEKIQKG